MAIDWNRLIVVRDETTVNLLCGKEILYVKGLSAGRGIVSIVKTGTDKAIDTYTITYTDGTTSTFEVTNGNYVLAEGTVTFQKSREQYGYSFYNIPTVENEQAESLCIDFVATQAGSGTPSGSNIRALQPLYTLNWYVYETGGSSTGILKALPETSYGGSYDIAKGVYTRKWAYIASYAGESLPGEWMSDRDVYAEGTTPTTGAEVAYKLSTPVEIAVTATSVNFYDGGTEVAISKSGNAELKELTASVVPGYIETKDYIDDLFEGWDAPTDGRYYWKHNGSWENVKTGIVYYVNASTGSDSNNGTSSTTPFKTITKAVSACRPVTAACKIYIAAGSYSEDVTIQNANIILTSQGNVVLNGSWLIVRAYVELNGSAFSFMNQLLIYNNSCVLDTGLTSLVITTSSGSSLVVYASKFFVLSSVTIQNTSAYCVEVCYEAEVYLGTPVLYGNLGIFAYNGGIVSCNSIDGTVTTQKITSNGGRIFIGSQKEFYSKTEVDNLLSLKAPIASPELTGTPKSTTPPAGDSSTRIATTAFVQAAMADLVLSLICINVVLDGTVYKLEYCGPFEITEADGIYYLNWCGMAETCPFTIDLVGTNYVLKYNE